MNVLQEKRYIKLIQWLIVVIGMLAGVNLLGTFGII